MRARMLSLAGLVLLLAGCASAWQAGNRPIPGDFESHRVEQINATGGPSVRDGR